MNSFAIARLCTFVASKQELVQGQAVSLGNQLNDLTESSNGQILRLVRSALNLSDSNAQENKEAAVEQSEAK